MAKIRTIEQGRALKAYELAVKGMEESNDYKNKVKSLPMMIKTNGFGASIAFAKSKNEWREVYGQMEGYLKQHDLYNHYGDINMQNIGLTEFLVKIDSTLYKAITIEILSLLTWLRRFAEGIDNKKD